MTRRLALLLFAGVMAAAPAALAAQETVPGPPVKLVPIQPSTPTAPNTPNLPPGVEAAPLAPLDPSWAGALPQGETPLPADMWHGTPRDVVRAALGLLEPTESPALHHLARLLLLSGAVAPRGKDPAKGPSLLLLRAQKLADLGALTGAAAVIATLPADKHTEPMDRLAVELAFAQNDITGACRQVAGAIMNYRNVWWDRAQIACQLLAGHRDKAALALDILHDRNEPPDPTFDALIAVAEGKPVDLVPSAKLTPLRATLWAASKRPLPNSVLATADAATLAAFAGSPAEPVANRLDAAERAARLGAWSPARLGRLYTKMVFTADERAKLQSDPRLGDTPRARALLYTVAASAGDKKSPVDIATRADALARFLAAARRHGLYFVAARLAAPLITAIAPADKLKQAAPAFVRALIAADRAKAIDPWVGLAGSAASRPLVAIVHAVLGGRFMPEPQTMSQAYAALQSRQGAGTAAQIDMFQMLATLFAPDVAPAGFAARIAPAHSGQVPNPTLWLDQEGAAAAHRLGETILTSLILAADKNRLTLEPIPLDRALRGLRAIGREEDARAIAFEAAIAVGL